MQGLKIVPHSHTFKISECFLRFFRMQEAADFVLRP